MPVSPTYLKKKGGAAGAAAAKAAAIAKSQYAAAVTGHKVVAQRESRTGTSSAVGQVAAVNAAIRAEAERKVREREAAAAAARERNRALGITGPSASLGRQQTFEEKVKHEIQSLSPAEEARIAQSVGAAAIFARVNRNEAAQAAIEGRAAPKASQYTIDTPRTGGARLNLTTGEIIPPSRKTIASPDLTRTIGLTIEPEVYITQGGEQPPKVYDSYAPNNTLPPIKAGVGGATVKNTQALPARYMPQIGPISGLVSGIGQNMPALSQYINNLIQQLSPGVTARLSVSPKRAKRGY